MKNQSRSSLSSNLTPVEYEIEVYPPQYKKDLEKVKSQNSEGIWSLRSCAEALAREGGSSKLPVEIQFKLRFAEVTIKQVSFMIKSTP